MKAIEIKQAGSEKTLQLGVREIPVPKTGELLIQVYAAGVNRPDMLQRLGRYSPPEGVSDILGLEVAGEVMGGDTENSPYKKGDMVCALLQGGGYAEYCTAPIQQCLPVPKGLTLIEAASLPETYFTVWSNVFEKAGLKGNESLFVQGGTSGIGVAAIQLASAFGHRVFATARTAEKCKVCEQLGAERGINYSTEDFVEIIREHTNGRGVDVVLDIMGGDYVQREIDVLADEGRIVMIAHIGGGKGTIDFRKMLHRRLTITASTLRPRSVEFKGAIAASLHKNVWPLFESGRIKPVIDQIFPLERAEDAHQLMLSSEHIGKIMLQVI